EQGFNYSSFAPNLTYTTVPANAMSNYSWERLQSDEDYKSYYKGLFDTLNLLNYAQAMAYIKLPWEDQTKLGSQARYMTSASQILNNESSTAPLDRVGTEWRHLDVIYAGSQSSLQLRTLESLWDNRIVINPNFVRSNTIMQFSSNSYSSTPGAAAMWFTPHNDFGVSDGVINKYYAFMMAGEAGWQGTKNVLSGTMTDLQMLRASTGDENATWRSYTLNSMRQAASEASARGVDVDAMIEKFYQAMLADSRGAASYAENNQKSWSYKRTVDQRLAYFNEIKQATDDFRTAYRP
ncbi:MAG: ZmpA/ZmpB/ZmpC family metallo-endopeptidase, partial [Corynebacterium sp.]|nr:ZmpA/ZmpB/ZmpC family metallo-endopeptidase [Corynebacterium sp.]